jgi:hypothetical protein
MLMIFYNCKDCELIHVNIIIVKEQDKYLGVQLVTNHL